ncbi:MAG TPA: aspartate--tRNA ligase [Acidimicrobiales bacterium]|nr:aspartate--tRNA ligase [Acidimicrobiales bacterium]
MTGTGEAPVGLGMRTHYCGVLRAADAGSRVSVCGWVARRREHGEHLAFLDVRDHTGVVQCVVERARAIRPEYVVRVTGTVRVRPEGTANPALPTGEVELGECDVETLAKCAPVPFSLDERVETEEALRLRHRYIDLRSERMQANLRLRSVVNSAIRRSMERQGFVEVETPLLWTPTPEGAREFVVPSRLQPGLFYALPQSPQIAKQLTMIGGIDRYYQIARCLRDEDLRADRQFEFTQLDVEASFVGEDEILGFVTEAMVEATEAATGERPGEFAKMTWPEALDRYGTDKPDLRFGMEIVDVAAAVAGTGFRALQAPSVKAIVVAGGVEFSRARLDELVGRARSLGAAGLVWLRAVGDPVGFDGPAVKHLAAAELAAILAATSAGAGDLVLIVAGEHRRACEVLGQLRVELGRPATDAGPLAFCWVVDFPLFDGVDEDGHPQAAHHPFTMPRLEDLEKLATDPFAVRAHSYDLILDGWELGSGSIRIHQPELQRRVFAALGISAADAEARFGFLLDAYRYGGPPHGGFAVGLDRFVAILAGEENIREVIAFPKTQSGSDPLTGGPLPLEAGRLAELGLRVGADAPATGARPSPGLGAT